MLRFRCLTEFSIRLNTCLIVRDKDDGNPMGKHLCKVNDKRHQNNAHGCYSISVFGNFKPFSTTISLQYPLKTSESVNLLILIFYCLYY